MFKENSLKIYLILAIILILLILFYLFINLKNNSKELNLDTSKNILGVTYSDKFAQELNLDSVKAHQEIISDLQIKYIRLPIYWDQVEKKEGVFDFSEYEKIIQDGSKENVQYILSVGYRLPRWPECHFPKWFNQVDLDTNQGKLLNYLEKTVINFKEFDNVLYWQVENEPYLNSFGLCPKYNEKLLLKELDLVRSLDDRKIVISSSGELGGWKRENKVGDIFATTLYRVVYNPIFGYFKYPLPPWFYKLKAKSNGVDLEKSILIELQAEPWVKDGTLVDIEFKEYNKSFSLDQFKDNTNYAINTGFKQIYFWGVEWWYLQKQKGNDTYYNLAKEIFKK